MIVLPHLFGPGVVNSMRLSMHIIINLMTKYVAKLATAGPLSLPLLPGSLGKSCILYYGVPAVSRRKTGTP